MVHQPISNLAVGDAVNGIYLLRCAKVQHSKNGSEYLLATLADKSGSISCILPMSSESNQKVTGMRWDQRF